MRHWILRRAALPLLALLLATVNVSRVAAQSCEEGSPAAYINLQENEPTFACQLPFPVGLVTVNVIVRAIPFQKIRFKLVDPPLGTVVGETWNGTASGDRVNGIEIDMGGCTGQELILVGTLTIIQPGDTAPCTFWNPFDCEVQDCTGDWRPAVAVPHEVSDGYCEECCFQCCYYALAAYDMYPPNGATAVALDVVLSWDGTHDSCNVRISASPDCGSGTTYPVSCNDQTFAPDFLEPNTTYYWQPSWSSIPDGCSDLNSGYGPLYSFTTQGPNATLPTTWGHVKSLYR